MAIKQRVYDESKRYIPRTYLIREDLLELMEKYAERENKSVAYALEDALEYFFLESESTSTIPST